MKKSSIFCRILCLILAILLLQIPVFAAQTTASAEDDATESVTEYTQQEPGDKPYDASVEKGCHSIDGKFPFLGMESKVKNAQAAVLYDFTNDTLMYAWNADMQVVPASLVKIMTGMIVAQTEDLSQEVTIPEDYQFSLTDAQRTSKLQPGETISLENLLYCILVGSSNDASVIAAEHLFGTQEAFVEEMNRQAEELGCTGTFFSDVTGLDEEYQYTTARDVGRILSAALKIDAFKTVFSTTHYTVSATNLSQARRLVSNNWLAHTDVMERYYDSRVTGGRIGVTSDGNRNVAVTASRNDIELISIIIGSVSTYTPDGRKTVNYGGFQETIDLLNLGYKGFSSFQIIYANQALMQYKVNNGECDVVLCPHESVSVVLPYSASLEDLSFRYSSEYEGISAPINKGDRVSALEVWYNSLCISQVDLYAMNQVRVKEANTAPVVDDGSNKGISPFIIILIIIIVLVILLLGRRIIFRMIHQSRIRRHRKNRRRSR